MFISSPLHLGCLRVEDTRSRGNKATSVVWGIIQALSLERGVLFLWAQLIPSALLACLFYPITQHSSHMQLLPGPVYARTSCLCACAEALPLCL